MNLSNLSEPFPPAHPPNSSIAEIVAFHRGLCSTDDLFLHPFLLVIVDSDHCSQSGVLLVNLSAYDDLPWKADYMRWPLDDAQGTLATINIGQSDWEEKMDCAEFGLQWDRYFAKYPTHVSSDRCQEFWDLDTEFRKALEGPERQRFRTWGVRKEGTLLGGNSVADIAKIHHTVAREDPEYHEGFFIWFDLDFWNTQRGIIVVKALGSEVQDIKKLPIAEAANLLVDIAMGCREW